MVTRRLVPLVVTLALALAPVALEACQATCALHTAAAVAAPAAAQHTCHHVAASRPAGGAEMRGIPHNCAHADSLPTACGSPSPSGPSAPAVVPAVVSYQAPADSAACHVDSTPSTSPPRTSNPGQLRV